MTGIVTSGLRKTFRRRARLFGRVTETVAVDGLDLVVPPGRVTGLLGLNGAGKTTTIKVLSTLLLPTSGTVTVDGVDVTADPRAVRRRINLISGGDRMVYARMTGRENLVYFGRLYAVPREVLRRRADELLELVGLTDAADVLVERYSRGMTQRLSIARGLVNDPAYLLLDEPTIGLDAPIARDLRAVVAGLAARGTGVLLTSHYLAEVEQLCEHVYVIADGRHLAAGTPAQLTAAGGITGAVEVLVTDPSPAVAVAAEEFAARAGSRLAADVRADGALALTLASADPGVAGPFVSALAAAGATVAGLRITEPKLEDAILALAAGPAASEAAPTGAPA